MEKKEQLPEFSVEEFLNIPVESEYFYIDKPKQHIAKSIKEAMDEKGLSLRQVAINIHNFSYPQITRITKRENYNIHTLLKVLNELDLEIVIQPRQKEQD